MHIGKFQNIAVYWYSDTAFPSKMRALYIKSIVAKHLNNSCIQTVFYQTINKALETNNIITKTNKGVRKKEWMSNSRGVVQ